jgi:hypothetical protein
MLRVAHRPVSELSRSADWAILRPKKVSLRARTSQSKAGTGRQPAWARHRDLHDLVGEPSTRSDELRRRWSSQDVRFQATHDVDSPVQQAPNSR